MLSTVLLFIVAMLSCLCIGAAKDKEQRAFFCVVSTASVVGMVILTMTNMLTA